jgi:hypothetical protein
MKLKQNHETGVRRVPEKLKLWQFKPKSCVKETQNYTPLICEQGALHRHHGTQGKPFRQDRNSNFLKKSMPKCSRFSQQTRVVS